MGLKNCSIDTPTCLAVSIFKLNSLPNYLYNTLLAINVLYLTGRKFHERL